ncbi:Uncharacterised protein [Vibrio cholerae]|nr:Uncharacterised protein [Vibrio cholerae]CSI75857.1 Uncharacterised protein [Vibrio cholerae]
MSVCFSNTSCIGFTRLRAIKHIHTNEQRFNFR